MPFGSDATTRWWHFHYIRCYYGTLNRHVVNVIHTAGSGCAIFTINGSGVSKDLCYKTRDNSFEGQTQTVHPQFSQYQAIPGRQQWRIKENWLGELAMRSREEYFFFWVTCWYLSRVPFADVSLFLSNRSLYPAQEYCCLGCENYGFGTGRGKEQYLCLYIYSLCMCLYIVYMSIYTVSFLYIYVLFHFFSLRSPSVDIAHEWVWCIQVST